MTMFTSVTPLKRLKRDLQNISTPLKEDLRVFFINLWLLMVSNDFT
ncbi:237R [Invertebrate iridescent virus Kaz2018]|uniref:237R n=1 Tax=Invertebrate iridescent virus 6 TaxID=176652 RepID=Q91FT5_IIV6|nr:237R [Invertebrate iridescent virus 6]AAK82098.1 237R [Invertebrate iridescent virus 6]QNH08647.1 237R [Invertebrate iridescent virus Kaz2018]